MTEIIISNYPAKITVRKLEEKLLQRKNEDRVFFVGVIRHRLIHRYMEPLSSQKTSSFLLVAVSCLLIETLQSFRAGQNNTNRKSQKTFKDFFEGNSDLFPGFSAVAKEFYENIRCGILHQAETTNGWRLKKVGPLLDSREKVINGELFFRAVRKAVEKYLLTLKTDEIETQNWRNALIKLKFICDNCKESERTS
jgi:hypothetical protein